MRAGATREYLILTFIELVIFTIGVLLDESALIAAFFLILVCGFLLFYGHEVRIIGRNKIVLEWGLVFKRRREISPSEILDVIDAPSSRYFSLARYRPEMILIPIGMIVGGFSCFYRPRTVRLDWDGCFLGQLI